MPTPRPIFVSPYSKSLFTLHLPKEQIPQGGRAVANNEGDAEVYIYSADHLDVLKIAAEEVDRSLNPDDESYSDDKRQISLLLGTLSVHKIVLQQYPYAD